MASLQSQHTHSYIQSYKQWVFNKKGADEGISCLHFSSQLTY